MNLKDKRKKKGDKPLVSNSLLVAMAEARRLQACGAPVSGHRPAGSWPPHHHGCSQGPGRRREAAAAPVPPPCLSPCGHSGISIGGEWGRGEQLAVPRLPVLPQVPVPPCVMRAGPHAPGLSENGGRVGEKRNDWEFCGKH